MSKKSLNGKYGPGQKDGKKRRNAAAPLMPLDYALTRMRDESLAPETRDSMAKAAMPFTHGRRVAEEPPAPTPQEQAQQWSDIELARRIAHILMLADKEQDLEQEEKNMKVEDKTRPRSDGQEGTQEKVQDIAPGPVTTIAPHLPAPAVKRCPPQHSAQVLSDQVLPDDERGRCEDDPFDPHPGYRWIP